MHNDEDHAASPCIDNSRASKPGLTVLISSCEKKTPEDTCPDFSRPVSANIKWKNIEQLFVALGAEIIEGEGSRIGVRLFGEPRVFHRPHPSPNTDKGAVDSVRNWLEANGVKP